MTKCSTKKRLALKTLLSGCLFLLAVSLTPALSSAFFDLSLMSGVSVSNFDQTPNFATTTSPGVGLGAGVLLAVDVMPLVGLESGLFYQQHTIKLQGLAGYHLDGSIQLTQWALPLMLRIQPLPFFAIEGGGYFGLSTNSTTTVNTTGTAPGLNLGNGHGLIAGASFMFPLLPAFNFRLSGFYEYGLTNIALDSSTTHARNIDILAGIMFDL